MNGDNINWTGGTHRFFLRIGELRSLQQACDAGPMHIFMRLSSHQWKVDDIIETIVLGLVGGSDMKEVDARKLVRRVIEEDNAGQLAMHAPVATEILRLSILLDTKEDDGGDEDDDVGKTTAETGSATNLTSEPSINPVSHSGLPPAI